VTKIGVILTFLAKSAQKIGHYGRTENCKKLQKIEFFFEKGHFYAYFERFMAKSWHITGTYAEPKIAKNCKKLNFFSNLQYNYTVNG